MPNGKLSPAGVDAIKIELQRLAVNMRVMPGNIEGHRRALAAAEKEFKEAEDRRTALLADLKELGGEE